MVEFNTNEEYREFANKNLEKVNILKDRLAIGHTILVKKGNHTLTLTKIEGDYEDCGVYVFSFDDLSEEYTNIGTEELPFEVVETLGGNSYNKWLEETDKNKESYVEWLENSLYLSNLSSLR